MLDQLNENSTQFTYGGQQCVHYAGYRYAKSEWDAILRRVRARMAALQPGAKAAEPKPPEPKPPEPKPPDPKASASSGASSAPASAPPAPFAPPARSGPPPEKEKEAKEARKQARAATDDLDKTAADIAFQLYIESWTGSSSAKTKKDYITLFKNVNADRAKKNLPMAKTKDEWEKLVDEYVKDHGKQTKDGKGNYTRLWAKVEKAMQEAKNQRRAQKILDEVQKRQGASAPSEPASSAASSSSAPKAAAKAAGPAAKASASAKAVPKASAASAPDMTADEVRAFRRRVNNMSASELDDIIAIFQQPGDLVYNNRFIDNEGRQVLLQTMRDLKSKKSSAPPPPPPPPQIPTPSAPPPPYAKPTRADFNHYGLYKPEANWPYGSYFDKDDYFGAGKIRWLYEPRYNRWVPFEDKNKKSFPHGFQCTLVRLAKRQMFLYHFPQHKQHVPFTVVTFMAKQGIRLSSCELFIDHGLLNQFCNCHFILAAISW